MKVNSMPTFLLISRHHPESCWMFHEEARNVHRNLLSRLDELMEKYGVTLLGCWFVLTEHALYEVYDAPSLEVFQQMSTEPEIAQWLKFNTMEIKLVTSVEDVKRMLG
jgi:hypothetical protein